MSETHDIEDIYELAPLQQGMLVETLLAPGSGVYHEQMSFPMAGDVDLTALRAAWQDVMGAHAVMRTSFHFEDIARPLQVVHRDVRVPFTEEDWRGMPATAQGERLERLLAEDARRGFELDRAPLMRIAVLRLGAGRTQFVWSFHHALLDGWSVQIVLRDVADAYRSRVAGGSRPRRAATPYAEYVGWLQCQDADAAERYWRTRLAGFTEATPLHVDGLGQQCLDAAGHGDAERRLDATVTAALQRLARARRVTLNTVVQAAWALLLSHYADEDDVVFGAVVSGRPADLTGVQEMVGLFINTLPVRALVPRDRTVAAWLEELQRESADSRRYEFSPLTDVVGWSDVGRGQPLFETALVFENYPAARGVGGAPGAVRHVERTNLPITLLVVPGERLLCKLLYDRERLDAETVTRLLGHLARILEGFAVDADRPPHAIPILDADETAMLDAWNATERPYRLDWTLAGRFAHQAAERPDAPAVIAGDEVLTYRELDELAARVAGALRRCGVGRGDVVGMLLERSPLAVAAVLGIIKVGAAFLPLDPACPADRLVAMADDAGTAALITRAGLEIPALAGGRPLVHCDAPSLAAEPPATDWVEVEPHDLCYVIYTSGSTGRPKGVAVEHRQVLNRLEWMWEAHPFAPGEVGCAKTALGFVDAIWELLGPLLTGTPTAIVADEDVRDAERLVVALARHRATRIWVVPSLLRVLLERYPDLRERLPALDFWVVSGEPLTLDLRDAFARAMPGATLYNLYGTSEIWDATWDDPASDPPDPSRVSIGRPIANVQARVLSRTGAQVPIGVPGELHVGGMGLARGYVGMPEATAERFVPDPFTPGGTLYRTGDLVRWLPCGTLEFLGRLDAQVKLHGHRIEPAEVEAVLRAHPDVREAGVTLDASTPGDPRLVAAVAADGVHADDLRGWARERLPASMVPAVIAVLDDLPLTSSGKLDRRRLPDVIGSHDAAEDPAAVAPRTPEEQRLAAMVADLLHMPTPGVLDDFFADLGGNSLQATRLVARVRDVFGVELPLRRFFERPTVAALAHELLSAPREVAAPIARVDRERFRARSEP